MATADLTAQRLRELFSYDETTGLFVRIKPVRGARSRVGHLIKVGGRAGYVVIGIDGKEHYAHRLAWLIVHGEFPRGVIDHKNGDRADNRITNLRDVTQGVNMQNMRAATAQNTKSGVLGAHWHPHSRRWMSSVKVQGKKHHLGYFLTADEAHRAYIAAKRRLHEGNTL